jgi:hypothetical protein
LQNERVGDYGVARLDAGNDLLHVAGEHERSDHNFRLFCIDTLGISACRARMLHQAEIFSKTRPGTVCSPTQNVNARAHDCLLIFVQRHSQSLDWKNPIVWLINCLSFG